MALEQSILKSTKKILGIDDDYDVFDHDIIVHINSVLSTLHQLGIGPAEGFIIDGDTETWDQFIGANNNQYNPVKSYMYLRVRRLFDPPATSFHLDALEKQIQELEWRLNVAREYLIWPEQAPEDSTVMDAGGVGDLP